MKLPLLLGIFSLSLISTAAHAQVFWRDSNDGTTGANWVNGFGTGGGQTPGPTDHAVISGDNVADTTVIYVDSVVPDIARLTLRDRGATLQIREGGYLNSGATTFETRNEGLFTLSIQGGTMIMGYFSPGGSDFNLSVSSGSLSLTESHSSSGLILAGGASVNLSGGVLDLGYNDGARAYLRLANGVANGNFTWTGGTLRGVERFQGDNATASAVTNGGGTMYIDNIIRTDDMASYLNGTGTFVLAIEDDGTTNADLAQYSGGGVWDLTTGTVAVDFGDYTPMIGDSWDFTNLAAGAGSFLASGANVSSLSTDGKWDVTWDTSEWETLGILGITDVAMIPEPGTMALLTGGLAGLLLFRRRRS